MLTPLSQNMLNSDWVEFYFNHQYVISHDLYFFVPHCLMYEGISSGIRSFEWSWWSGMTKFSYDVSNMPCHLCFIENSSYFCLGYTSNNMSDCLHPIKIGPMGRTSWFGECVLLRKKWLASLLCDLSNTTSEPTLNILFLA